MQGLSGLYLGLLMNKQRSKAEREHQELMLEQEDSRFATNGGHFIDDSKSHRLFRNRVFD